jgi:hypothetical protein
MLDRSLIIKRIHQMFAVNAKTEDQKKEVVERLYTKYHLPKVVGMEILTRKRDLANVSDFDLYAIIDIITSGHPENYFTPAEIAEFSKKEYEKISLPLKFNMVQITEDQWIGKISVKQLMELRDAQLVYYNENTQRTMHHVTRGDSEYYTITLNKKAVQEIQASMRDESFIPNTITLNMPVGTIYSYTNNVLTIREIEKFDILDGYHRFIAMSKIYNLDENFDYDMELRIVCFEEGKAKHFVWQEDQKTKMKKVDSESFNQNSEPNKIVQRLNTDATFIMAGKIKRNDYIINASDMALVIKRMWFASQNDSKSTLTKRSIEVKKKIQQGIEVLVSADEELVNEKWDLKYLCTVLVCIYAEVPNKKLKETVDRLYAENPDKIIASRLTRRILSRIEKMI